MEGQLELVVDFSDQNLYDPQETQHVQSVVIELSVISLEDIDRVCDRETHREFTMESPQCSLVQKEVCRREGISSTRFQGISNHDVQTKIHTSEGGTSATYTAIEKPLIPCAEPTHNPLSITYVKSKASAGHTSRVQRLREHGWNQYCTGANVPLSLKRSRHSLLGRFKGNPVLENLPAHCYIPPRTKDMVGITKRNN